MNIQQNIKLIRIFVSSKILENNWYRFAKAKKMYFSANQSIPQHINFTGKLENMMVQYSNAF